MVGISIGAGKISELVVDADLNMGAYNITLDATKTVDGQDVSGLMKKAADCDLVMGAHNITLGEAQTVDGKDVSELTAHVITKGSYTGNSTANRTIPHSLGAVPKQVLVFDSAGKRAQHIGTDNINHWYWFDAGGSGESLLVGDATSTNFVVGNAGSYENTMNLTGRTYYWLAWV